MKSRDPTTRLPGVRPHVGPAGYTVPRSAGSDWWIPCTFGRVEINIAGSQGSTDLENYPELVGCIEGENPCLVHNHSYLFGRDLEVDSPTNHGSFPHIHQTNAFSSCFTRSTSVPYDNRD